MRGHELEYDGGVHLTGSVLWFDAARHDILSFVSSARMDGAWRYARALCTDRTRTLLRVFRPSFQALVSPFGRSISLGSLQITMLPAGFMPGSAQVLVESGGMRTLYACNMSLEAHEMAVAPQFVETDTLVLKAAYGSPIFAFPSREEVRALLVKRAQEVLSTGGTPVFLCSPAGKAQEVVQALMESGLDVCVHRQIARINKAYRTLGFDPGPARACKGDVKGGECVIFPERLRHSVILKRLKKAHLIWLSGRSMIPDVLSRLRLEEGIPLAGHLDHAGLIEYVERTKASKIYTTGVWAEEFAADLRRRGHEALALHREEQLSLF